MKFYINESQYKLLIESNEYDNQLIDLFKFDSNTAIEVANSLNINIFDLIFKKYEKSIKFQYSMDISKQIRKGKLKKATTISEPLGIKIKDSLNYFLNIHDNLINKKFNSCEIKKCTNEDINFDFIIKNMIFYISENYNEIFINTSIENVDIQINDIKYSFNEFFNLFGYQVQDYVMDVVFDTIIKFYSIKNLPNNTHFEINILDFY